METKILTSETFYRFVSPSGISTGFVRDDEQSREWVKKGRFTVKKAVDVYSIGPSTQVKYRTASYKIGKILKITHKTIQETEEVNELP